MSVASAAPTVGTTATTFPQYWFRIAMGASVHHGYGLSVTQRLIAWGSGWTSVVHLFLFFIFRGKGSCQQAALHEKQSPK